MRIPLFVTLVLLVVPRAFADPWSLPQHLSSANTEITFEVDSTWHIVRGVAKRVDGELALRDRNDFRSLRAKIELPVASFETGNDSRDEKLREVMHTDRYPSVIFDLSQSSLALCAPETVKDSLGCGFDLVGDLTISGTTRKVTLRSHVTRSESGFEVRGTTTIRWKDYHIDDPSIVIARLHDDVKIDFLISLPTKN